MKKVIIKSLPYGRAASLYKELRIGSKMADIERLSSFSIGFYRA